MESEGEVEGLELVPWEEGVSWKIERKKWQLVIVKTSVELGKIYCTGQTSLLENYNYYILYYTITLIYNILRCHESENVLFKT